MKYLFINLGFYVAFFYLFIWDLTSLSTLYRSFYVAFSTVQVISRGVV